MGSPRNINVTITDAGGIVSWSPPEKGAEDVDYYRIRWSQGGSNFETATTKETFYMGILPHLTKISSQISGYV